MTSPDPARSAVVHDVAFAPDVRVYPYEDRTVVFRKPRSFVLRSVPTALRDALTALAEGPREPAALRALAAGAAPSLEKVAERLGHLLVHRLRADERTVARISQGPGAGFRLPPEVGPDQVVRLSRFSLLRADDGVLVLESGMTQARVALTAPAARTVVSAMAAPVTPREAAEAVGLDLALVCRLTGVIAGLGLACVASTGPDGSAVFAEDHDPALRHWDLHDSYFHGRSRPRDAAGSRFLGVLPSPPVARPQGPGAVIELPRPSLTAVLERDARLTEVLESRRSVLTYGSRQLSLEELGEFLHRAARVRSHHGTTPGARYYDWDARPAYERTNRPYPSADGAYELELYLTVNRCASVPEGVYHYDPFGHRLTAVDASERDRAAQMAEIARVHKARPDVLITMTSRIARLSWHYDSFAYALTLQHVGVLSQTMYLVATGMRLGPCSLKGVGDAEITRRALGLRGPEESVVGEFALGTLPPPDRRGAADPADELFRPVDDAEWAAAGRTGHPGASPSPDSAQEAPTHGHHETRQQRRGA